MNLIYKTLLNKEFNDVPSRSERAYVIVAKLDGSIPVFVMQYHHHEDYESVSGEKHEIISKIIEDFKYIDRQDYPGTDAMLEEIVNTINKEFV